MVEYDANLDFEMNYHKPTGAVCAGLWCTRPAKDKDFAPKLMVGLKLSGVKGPMVRGGVLKRARSLTWT